MTNDTNGLAQARHQAAAFIDGIELPPAPRRKRSGGKLSPEIAVADGQQALVVGSEIVSFGAGINPQLREAIVNCSLIAQLAANRKVPERGDIQAWHAAYFDVLTNIGWAIEDRGFSEHHEASEYFEANTAILSVASVLLGPGSTAFALVKSTLESLKAMSEGPWLTIFRRESQAASAAKFQVSVAEAGTQGNSQLKIMAFELNADSVLTQVLFFKFKTSHVTLRHASCTLKIDDSLLREIAPRIVERVVAYQRSFIDSLPI